MTDRVASWGAGVQATWGDGVLASWGQETRRKGRIETTVDYDLSGDEEAVILLFGLVIAPGCKVSDPTA